METKQNDGFRRDADDICEVTTKDVSSSHLFYGKFVPFFFLLIYSQANYKYRISSVTKKTVSKVSKLARIIGLGGGSHKSLALAKNNCHTI